MATGKKSAKKIQRELKKSKNAFSAKPAKKSLVTKNSQIGQVVMKYPLAAEIMMERGLHCVGCHVSLFETIEQGAGAHGMQKKEIDSMVAEINRVAAKKKR